MNRLQQIESRIDRKLREVLRSSSPVQRREVVEVHRAILDEVASRVDRLPRGKVSFCYSQVKVQVLLAEPERRRSYELVFTEGDSLSCDIKSYFEEQRIDFPPRLKVHVELVASLAPEVTERGFDVSYSNASGAHLSSDALPIRLTILDGSAEQPQYSFAKRRIHIGRLAEVLDGDLRIVRRNDLALDDEVAGPNSTVSRTHAHLEFDPETSRYRVFDDHSSHGTTVVRDGSVIRVPQGTSKGVPLQTRDEIILGKVHIRFEIEEA